MSFGTGVYYRSHNHHCNYDIEHFLFFCFIDFCFYLYYLHYSLLFGLFFPLVSQLAIIVPPINPVGYNTATVQSFFLVS